MIMFTSFLFKDPNFMLLFFSLPTLVPVTVSDDPKNVYYDPNPGKTRKAHTQQTSRNADIR